MTTDEMFNKIEGLIEEANKPQSDKGNILLLGNLAEWLVDICKDQESRIKTLEQQITKIQPDYE